MCGKRNVWLHETSFALTAFFLFSSIQTIQTRHPAIFSSILHRLPGEEFKSQWDHGIDISCALRSGLVGEVLRIRSKHWQDHVPHRDLNQIPGSPQIPPSIPSDQLSLSDTHIVSWHLEEPQDVSKPAVTSCPMLNLAYVGKQIVAQKLAKERTEWVIFNDCLYLTTQMYF